MSIDFYPIQISEDGMIDCDFYEGETLVSAMTLPNAPAVGAKFEFRNGKTFVVESVGYKINRPSLTTELDGHPNRDKGIMNIRSNTDAVAVVHLVAA